MSDMCYNDNVKKRRNIVARINCVINLKEDDKIVIDKKEVIGIKSDNKITFKDDDVIVTITTDNNKIMMTRVNKEYELNLEFEEGINRIGKYFLNNDNLWLPIEVFTDKILVSEKSVEVDYYIDKINFNFNISFEVIE